jgi:trehalose 6-phosphate synthase
MRRYLAKNDLEHWAGSFFDALRGQASGQPSGRPAGRSSAPLTHGRDGAQG